MEDDKSLDSSCLHYLQHKVKHRLTEVVLVSEYFIASLLLVGSCGMTIPARVGKEWDQMNRE